MAKIRLGIVGIGNCASSLVQGFTYYKGKSANDAVGLMHWKMGGYLPTDIEVSCAFDIDRRKVGKDVGDAIYALPNNTTVFAQVGKLGVNVEMGVVLDGVAEHMKNYADENTFLVSDAAQPAKDMVVKILKDSGTEVLVNYLPVGSQQATEFYAECALEAGVAFVNCIPVFIASNPEWAKKFEEKKLPIVGDDIKAQAGATITHRALTTLFRKRGVKLERTYQINTGGNTDFLNMLNRARLASKKVSKTEAVTSVVGAPMAAEDVHIGPSDYVPWQKDNKVAFIRLEGKLFGDVPMNVEVRLSVEDSPNSAGVALDAIRCAKIALDRGIGGVVKGPSAYFMKHPSEQFDDDVAERMVGEFIKG